MPEITRRPSLRISPQPCSFDGCGKFVKYRGLCAGHAEQRRQGRDLRPLRYKRPDHSPRSPCAYLGCRKTSAVRGLCEGHYEHLRRGEPLHELKPRRSSYSSLVRDDQGRRHCPTCGIWLEIAEFSKQNGSYDGLTFECRSCAHSRRRLAKYNVTVERYDEMLSQQGGGCAICQSTDPRGHDLAVDHDHSCCPEVGRSCGRCIRGLLCWACNTAVGQMQDSPDRLRAAASYLEVYERVALEHVE